MTLRDGSEKMLLLLMSESVWPMFSSKSFMVPGLLSRSFIHLELIFVGGIGSVLISFFSMRPSSFPSTTYPTSCPFSIVCSRRRQVLIFILKYCKPFQNPPKPSVFVPFLTRSYTFGLSVFITMKFSINCVMIGLMPGSLTNRRCGEVGKVSTFFNLPGHQIMPGTLFMLGESLNEKTVF